MRFVILLSVVILFASPAVAGTYNAATCNRSDVDAVINGPTHTAVDGDIINIPAGSCSWTAVINVFAGISIIGAGPTTIIEDNNPGGTLLIVNLPAATSQFRLSSIKFTPVSGLSAQVAVLWMAGICNSTTCAHVRIDNLDISTWTNYLSYMFYVDNVFGVMDHNTISCKCEVIDIAHSKYLGVGELGDNDWATADSYGTDNAFYFETNTFTIADGNQPGITDAHRGGGRFVARFNTVQNVSFQTHGTESGGRVRSVRHVEIYNNTMSLTANSTTSILGLRGGTALVFNNTMSSVGNYQSIIGLTAFRTTNTFPAVIGSPAWGNCNGQGPFDNNDGVVYATGTISSSTGTGPTLTVTDNTKTWTTNQWAGTNITNGTPYSMVNISRNDNEGSHPGAEISSNTGTTLTSDIYAVKNPGVAWQAGDTYQILRKSACMDAAGNGGAGATLLSGQDPMAPGGYGWVNQPRDPVYEWANTGPTPSEGLITYKDTYLYIPNRDYYYSASYGVQNTSPGSPFNGTVGTGYGIRANRPTTCTTGVVYWSTDQGNWNHSGSGGQGVLDKCTATNTWTNAFYTPYDYPHPMVTGSAPTATVSQSGYRWRNDDGSETTANWKAAQNTSTSVDKNTAIRLRTQLNGTLDPASAAYRLEYKLSTDSNYKVVPLPAAQQVSTITTPGSGTFTGPADTTTAQVECWGAGAAGARAIEDNKSGAGGGGGGYAVRTAIGLTEGSSYSYSVGAGGTDGTSPAGGGDTTFTGNSSVQCVGKGATSLTYNGTTTNQSGGAGGTGSTGDTTRTGGAGGAGANTSVAGWTKVQFASNLTCTASSTTCAVTVASTGTGHVLVAGMISSGTATAMTISSVSGAGTWTLCTSSGCAINGGASFANLDLAYNLNSTSGVTSITVTRNTTASSTGWKAFVAEYSFSAGSVAIDAVGVVDRTAANASTKAGVTLSLSGSNDLCVQMIEANKNVSSVDSGFAIRTGATVGYAFADAVAKTSCAETWSLASAGKSVHSALAIKLTGGGGTIFSGGGGESACTTGTGNAGTTGATTGAGGTGCDGGDGGNGVAAGTAGANGTAPGGGGSGGYRDTATSRDAGAGANGQLKITYTPSPKLDVALSSNVAASCATATTAQLAAPTSKTTSDFTAGKICDDTASATVDIASGQYTELEWSLIFTSAATYDQVYQFRVTNAGTPLDSYDVTPSIVVHTPPVPALSSISPTSGNVGAVVPVTIHGADLDTGNAVIGISGTGITISNQVLVNATTMTANFTISGGAGLGSRNVTVTTDTGTTNAVTFTVTNTPTFTGISPSTAARNGTQSVTLTGTGLNVGSAAINVSGTGITVTDLVVQSSTQITADFVIDGTATTGNRTVTITTVGGTSGPQTFVVTSGLAINTLTPSNAIRGSTLDVVIAGSGFSGGYMGGDALVAFASSTGITINSTTVNSDSQITVNITIDAAAAATVRTVTVTTDDGSTNGLSFTVTAPAVPGAFSAARMRTR